MKKHISFFRVVIGMVMILSVFHVAAQETWTTGGNNADSTDFIGTINAEPLRIKTDSVDRIIVGVNDTIEFKGTAVFDSIKIPNGFMQVDSIRARVIHVGDSSLILGGVLSPGGNDQIQSTNGFVDFFETGILATRGAGVGTGALLPNGLANPRLIWYPRKAAFRAGTAGSNWDDANIGNYSVAMGFDCLASGGSSISIGSESQVTSNVSAAIGYQNKVLGSSNAQYAFGSQNELNGNGVSVAIGHFNNVQNGYTFGSSNLVTGAGGFSIGLNCKSSGQTSFTFGNWVNASATNSFTIGRGVQFTSGLTNNISNSLMIGFSNTPTLFVNDGSVGIGTTTPANKLEINHGTSGNSGLRFTQLTSSAAPSSNPGAGVLAVNATGDVIYVEANNATSVGNFCIDPQNPLTGNFEVPLDNNNYYFSGQGNNPDPNNIGSSVAIGLDCGDPIPLAKLHVRQLVTNPSEDFTSVAGFFENQANGELTLGVASRAFGDTSDNIGGFFEATGQSTNASQSGYGAWGIATDALDENTGVKGDAYGGDFSFGVKGYATGAALNIAVFGQIDTAAPFQTHFAGYFDGDVFTTSAQYFTSDIKFKSNIKDLSSSNALALINRLTPKSYDYKTADYPSMNLPKGSQYGVIAQEVETVFPALVQDAIHPPKRDKQGKVIHPAVSFKAVNYTGFIPVLIGAVKEQQHTIDSLKEVINERLASLENRLNGCCGTPQHYKTDPNEQNTKNVQDVALSNPQTIILDQNTPNPFAEKTVIGYALPVDVQLAEIIFHNAEGKQINRTAINARGNGEINVYAQDLSSGIYTYTLIVDGKIIDTKRMVKK